MFGLFQRAKLEARFEAAQAWTDEFARQMGLSGRLTISNDGADSEVGDVEMLVIAGFRRIPLEVPPEWRTLKLAKGGSKEGDVSWGLTLDAPLRAERGELYLSVRDGRHKKWEWRLPFAFVSR